MGGRAAWSWHIMMAALAVCTAIAWCPRSATAEEVTVGRRVVISRPETEAEREQIREEWLSDPFLVQIRESWRPARPDMPVSPEEVLRRDIDTTEPRRHASAKVVGDDQTHHRDAIIAACNKRIEQLRKDYNMVRILPQPLRSTAATSAVPDDTVAKASPEPDAHPAGTAALSGDGATPAWSQTVLHRSDAVGIAMTGALLGFGGGILLILVLIALPALGRARRHAMLRRTSISDRPEPIPLEIAVRGICIDAPGNGSNGNGHHDDRPEFQVPVFEIPFRPFTGPVVVGRLLEECAGSR